MTDIRLLGPAKERILSRLRDGRQTAREVASDLGIQTSAARKHLERLVEMGTVRKEFVRGARGRPKKYYALTDAGVELFPRHYDVVLNEVLARLEADGGELSGTEVGSFLQTCAISPAEIAEALENAREIASRFETALLTVHCTPAGATVVATLPEVQTHEVTLRTPAGPSLEAAYGSG